MSRVITNSTHVNAREALLKCMSGDSISDLELIDGIHMIETILSVIGKIERYYLMSSELRRRLDTLEGFQRSRKN